MAAWTELLWLFFLLAAGTWLLSAVTSALLVPAMLPERLSPDIRTRRLLLTAWLPWIAPLLLLVSVCLQAGGKSLGFIVDHCNFHEDHHPHLCFTHLPAIDLNAFHALVLTVAVTVTGLFVTRFIRRERMAAEQFRTLSALAAGRQRLRILDDELPIAFAGGLRQPLVLISRGLLRGLTRHEGRIVLAHECAHLRHQDPKRSLLFEFLLLAHLPFAAGRLRRLWRQSLEEAADDRVAGRFGREAVAGTLIKVLRLGRGPRVGRLAAAGADPTQRIRRLLTATPIMHRVLWRFELAYVTGLAAIGLTPLLAHHWLETLIGLLHGH